MTAEIIIGFLEKPEDLEEFLAIHGFRWVLSRLPYREHGEEYPTRQFDFYDPERSRSKVEVNYRKDLEHTMADGKHPETLLDINPDFVANATVITYASRNPFDVDKQITIVEQIAANYHVEIFDGYEQPISATPDAIRRSIR